jgi:hypothetical protein
MLGVFLFRIISDDYLALHFGSEEGQGGEHMVR